ncbi:MAG: hypothetical protein R3E66_20735 [bacterium]
MAVSMAITRWWLDRKQAKHAETIQFFQPTRASGGRQREKTSPMVALTETQTATATSKRSMAEVLVATTRSRQRECPKCQRTFPESVVVCPHDATKLSIRGDARHRVKVLDGVRKPTCHSCGRRFEFGAKYCRFDGQRLSGESVERLAVVWVCRTCGDESLEEGHECAAGCDVIKIDPSDARVIPPMIPMMICDACHRVASPEVTHCPDDNEVLRPMHNVRGDALAPLGVGPRRRVCKQCGRRYSGAARYCAHDGEKLVPLN